MQLHKSMFRLALIALAGIAHSALAQQTEYTSMFDQTDTWEPYADASYAYDDNLFRTPTQLIDHQPTSDTSWRREAGLRVDEIYSRQHITANFDVNRTTFERFNMIDYDGKDAMLNWAWGIGHDFTGNLGDSYTQTLTPFTQFHTAALNLRSQRSEYFNEIWLLSPCWQLHGGIAKNALQYDLASQQFGDKFGHTSDIGLDYVSAAGNKVGIDLSRERGDYPNEQIIGVESVNNNYTQQTLQGVLEYTPGGLSRVSLRAGWVRREYDYFQVRDISGPSAGLILFYTPTGKTTLQLSLWRDIYASDDITVGYAVNKGISFTPVWNPTAKIQVQGMLKRVDVDYTNASNFTPLLPHDRIDTMSDASLTALYTPLRRVQVSLVLYADRLSSTIATDSYRDKGLLLNVRVAF